MRPLTVLTATLFFLLCNKCEAQVTPYEIGFSAGLKPYGTENSHPGWSRSERIFSPLCELRIRAGVWKDQLWLGFNFGFQQFEKVYSTSPDPRTNYYFSTRWYYSKRRTFGNLLLVSPELCYQFSEKKVTGGIGVGPTFYSLISGTVTIDERTYHRSTDSIGAFHIDSMTTSSAAFKADQNELLFKSELALRLYLMYKPVNGITVFLEGRCIAGNFLNDMHFGAALSAGVFYTMNRRKVYPKVPTE